MRKLHITLADQDMKELEALISHYNSEFEKNGFKGNISYSCMIRGCIHYLYVQNFLINKMTSIMSLVRHGKDLNERT